MRCGLRKASRNWRIRNGRSWRSGRRYSGEMLPVFAQMVDMRAAILKASDVQIANFANAIVNLARIMP